VDPYFKLLALVASLFFLPKMLQRFRIPSPLTELVLGLTCGPLVLGWVEPDPLLQGLAGLGISALFLFAGLEVDLDEFVERRTPIVVHLLIQAVLVVAAALLGLWFGLTLPVAVLVAAAVLSPSVGLIISALEARGYRHDLATWIKQKAVSAELLAVATVLVFSNTSSSRQFAVALGILAALLVAIPLLLWLFHSVILPWAPKTEFSFLLVLALLAAYVTHHVGVHYLAGAFIVGLVARRYLDWLGRRHLDRGRVTQAFTAFRFFASFFVPFFFFLVGVQVPQRAFGREAGLFALALLLVAVPLRLLPQVLQRRLLLGEPWRDAWRVAVFLVPTTVFTLAVAEILVDRFDIPDWAFGGLVAYGAATSLAPALLGSASPEEELEADEFGVSSDMA